MADGLLTLQRVSPTAPGLTLDMSILREAEARLQEVKMVSPVTAPELGAYFNEACTTGTKYMAWIEYEILQAEKAFDLAKAAVILDKAPEEFKKLKDTGIKFNEDFRNALMARDPDCQYALDVLNSMKAAKSLISGYADSFKRAHYSCKAISDRKNQSAASPNMSGYVGQTYNEEQFDFMGKKINR
jgi:hypothetical protein